MRCDKTIHVEQLCQWIEILTLLEGYVRCHRVAWRVYRQLICFESNSLVQQEVSKEYFIPIGSESGRWYGRCSRRGDENLLEALQTCLQESSGHRVSGAGRISVSHLYNLRKSTTYQRRHFEKTRSRVSTLGECRKPDPEANLISCEMIRSIRAISTNRNWFTLHVCAATCAECTRHSE